jgi:hypothetical protein
VANDPSSLRGPEWRRLAAATRGVSLRFVLRALQGRLEDVEADVCSAVMEYASYPVWRAIRVSLYARLGRVAETKPSATTPSKVARVGGARRQA